MMNRPDDLGVNEASSVSYLLIKIRINFLKKESKISFGIHFRAYLRAVIKSVYSMKSVYSAFLMIFWLEKCLLFIF